MVKKILKYTIILIALLLVSNQDFTKEELKQAIREAKEIIQMLTTANKNLTKKYKEQKEIVENQNIKIDNLKEENERYKQAIKEARKIITEQKKIINNLNKQKINFGTGIGYYQDFLFSLNFSYSNYNLIFLYNKESFGLLFCINLL